MDELFYKLVWYTDKRLKPLHFWGLLKLLNRVMKVKKNCIVLLMELIRFYQKTGWTDFD